MIQLTNPWIGIQGYNCLGCCPDNPIGAHMSFYEDGDDIVCVWVPTQNHQSWINTLHGGMQATLLDEICGWIPFRKNDAAAVTAKMELRYRKPVSTIQSHIVLRAHAVEQRRNVLTVHGEILAADGTLCCECTCTYFVFTHEKSVEEMGFVSCGTVEGEVTMEQAIERAIAQAKSGRYVQIKPSI